MRKRPSVNVLLTVVGALLALNVLVTLAGSGGSPVAFAAEQPAAQSGSSDTPFNAARNANRVAEELSQISDRLARIEAKLDKGLSVKVTEMPPIKLEGGKD